MRQTSEQYTYSTYKVKVVDIQYSICNPLIVRISAIPLLWLGLAYADKRLGVEKIGFYISDLGCSGCSPKLFSPELAAI